MKNNKLFQKVKSISKKFGIEIIIIIAIFIGVGVYIHNTNNKEDDNKIQLSKTLKAPKKYKELDIDDIDARVDKNGKHFTFYLENNTDKDFAEREVKVVFLSSTKKILFEEELLLHEIKAGEKVSFDYILNDECFDAHTFTMVDVEKK